jgi:hypothetical protein
MHPAFKIYEEWRYNSMQSWKMSDFSKLSTRLYITEHGENKAWLKSILIILYQNLKAAILF